ncbi:MAG: sensor domain-containing diguanylate cyclase [Betaproteobacteria bacterium]
MRDQAAILADEHEALIQFLYLAPVGLAQTSMEGDIVLINPISAQLLMPLSRDGTLANLFTALEGVAPDLRHRVSAFAASSGMVCDGLRIRLSAGERGKSAPQTLSLSLLKLDETRLMAVLNDISLQVQQERLLKKNEAWFNAILTGISDYALMSLDSSGRIDEWNASISRVTGFSRDDVLGQPFSIFYPDGAMTADRLLDRMNEADDDGWTVDEGWRVKADGTRFWGSAMIAPLREQAAPGTDPALSVGVEDSAYCLIVRDITDKREASEARRKDLSCDFLTGIANRRTFFEAAELELERRKRSPREISLILFDIDHFKHVNDTYGHPAGDAVLCHLANLLTFTFRQVDVVARFGGEEFAILLPSTNLQSAAGVADRLRRAVESKPVTTDGVSISYTLSGGVAAMDDSMVGLDALIQHADRALYAAKAAGRNRIECWSAEIQPGSIINPAGRRRS